MCLIALQGPNQSLGQTQLIGKVAKDQRTFLNLPETLSALTQNIAASCGGGGGDFSTSSSTVARDNGEIKVHCLLGSRVEAGLAGWGGDAGFRALQTATRKFG